MALLYEILSEGLMVVCGRFQTEGYLLQAMLYLECLRMEAELLEAFPACVKDQLLQEGLSREEPKKASWRSLATSMPTRR